MKKSIALTLALIMMLFTFVSCGDKTDPVETEPAATEPAATEPTPTEPAETEPPAPVIEADYDRVIVFCISGAGSMIRKAQTPNIDAILEDGILARKITAEAPAYTAENVGSMLHGVTVDKHGLNPNVIEDYGYLPTSLFPSVFKVARESYPTSPLAMFTTYADLKNAVEEDIDVYHDTAENDAALTDKIVSYLNENDPKLLFIEYHEAEAEGPLSGYGTAAQIEKITQADGYIGQVYDAIKARGLDENALIIITSDHYGLNTYNGTSDAASLNIYFGAKGHTINTETKIKSMEIRDISAVITYALGLTQPESWTAMVPADMFNGMEAVERPTGEVYVADDVVELDTTALYKKDGSNTYDRVIIFGVDGAGAFFEASNTPYINAIFENGAVTHTAQTVLPSISAQCWTALMYGVTPDLHGMTNSLTNGTYKVNPMYPGIFTLARKAFPDANLASFTTWGDINAGIVEEGIGVHKGYASDDMELTQSIIDYLDENDPKLLFIQFDQVDGRGHNAGFGSEWQRYQIGVTDGYIGQIYNKLLEEGLLENTLLILTPDHGGIGGQHGGSNPTELTIMYAVAGKTVKKGGTPTSLDENGDPAPMMILDTAAIVAHALGITPADAWMSTVPGDMFEGVEATVRPGKTIAYNVDHRDNESVPTPTPDSGKYITDVLGDKVELYLTFDGGVADHFGNNIATDGELNFIDGFYGDAIKLDDGSVEIVDFSAHKTSFTIAFWFKTPVHKFFDDITDPCIMANKEWDGDDEGFVFYLYNEFQGHDYQDFFIGFNFADGENRMDEGWRIPLDWQDGWVHVILTVDRTAGTVGAAFDFGEFATVAIPEELMNASFDGESGLIFGQDSTKEYESLPMSIDDVVIVNGTLNADEVAALADYYGVK